MANASSDEDLHARSDQVPKRSYLAQRTRQVQFLPPAEAVCLIPDTRVRYHHRFVRRPNMEARNLRSPCSSQARTVKTSCSLGANQTGKSHQESTRIPKPPGICLEGSGSNLNPCLNDDNISVDPVQKAGFGVGKQKGQEITMDHKRKLAHDDGPGNAKLADTTTAETCSP